MWEVSIQYPYQLNATCEESKLVWQYSIHNGNGATVVRYFLDFQWDVPNFRNFVAIFREDLIKTFETVCGKIEHSRGAVFALGDLQLHQFGKLNRSPLVQKIGINRTPIVSAALLTA